MSWFDTNSQENNGHESAAATGRANAPASERASGRHAIANHRERSNDRLAAGDREQKIQVEPSFDDGSISSANERYNSMRQEIELAQRRLAVRERLLPHAQVDGQSAVHESYAPAQTDSQNMRLPRGPQSESPPPLPSMALWGTAALMGRTSNTSELPNVSGITSSDSTLNKTVGMVPKVTGSWVAERMQAAIRLPQEKPTREMLAVDASALSKLQPQDKSSLSDRIPSADRVLGTSEAKISVGPFSLSEVLRGPESESSKLLAQHRLYEKFSGTACHEHISWGPDGSVSVALKSGDGFRRTIVCRADGTSAQRITDPTGKEIFRFSSTGQVVKNFYDQSV